MLEPMTVWMVELERSPDDVEGQLSLDAVRLRFDPTDGPAGRTIDLTHVTKVKRVVGSPVFLVHSLEDGAKRATAFYLSKPPPLQPQQPGTDEPPPTVMGRSHRGKPTSARKQRRANASYLASVSSEVGDTPKAWVREIRAAIDAAREEGGS